MKKKINFILWLLAIVNLSAQIPAGYYDSAQGLSGYQLKTALKEIIDDHHDYGYDTLYDIYEDSDTDNYYEKDGTVLDMYSEKPNSSDAYNYHHYQKSCGTYSGEGDCYNREHIIPQSIFNKRSPMRSDAHFVVPSDGYVNNRRSSYPFGDVSSATWTSTNGSKLGSCADSGYSGTVFEPIDEFKGDIARMIFYVATRYEDQIAGWGSTAMFDGSSDQVFTDWFLQVLLTWHMQDPVSQREVDRNNAIYDWQENRNPFIDHPEWVNAIWNPGADTEAPTSPTSLEVQNIGSTSVELTWGAATDNYGVAQYLIFLDGIQVATATTTNYHLSNLQAETSYEVCVKAQDSAGNQSDCSNTVSFETLSSADDPNPVTDTSYLFEENFDDCDNMKFVAISEASDKDWICMDQYGEDDTPCIQINGYKQDEESKDWLITSAPINFDGYVEEKLSFYTVYKFGETPLEVLYSTDYDAKDLPSTYTWQPVPNITLPVPDGSSDKVTYPVIDADISSITGTAYIAFKYYTDNNAPTRWTLDSFRISGKYPNAINNNSIVNVNIYPNPVSGQYIYLNYGKQNLSMVKIYDITGKLLKQNKPKNHRILIKDFPNGVYFVNLYFDKNVITKKIVIE